MQTDKLLSFCSSSVSISSLFFLHVQPCLQTDFDIPRPQFPDLSLPSSLESPVAMTSEDFSLPGGPSGSDSHGPSSVGACSLNPVLCPSSDLTPQNREQAFRTEFNLIYTCSPLNANLGNPVATDRRLCQSEGGFSPAESFHSSISGQGQLGDVGTGSMSPYGEPHYGGGYPDSGTPPHTSNPPQKKKASSPHLNVTNVKTVLYSESFQVNRKQFHLLFSSTNFFECDMCKLESHRSWCAFPLALLPVDFVLNISIGPVCQLVKSKSTRHF